MTGLWEDCRAAVRSIVRSQRLFGLAAACLAIGVASAAVMFGVVDAYFLRPPRGVRDPRTVARIYFDRHLPIGRRTIDIASYPIFSEIRARIPTVQTEAYYLTFVSEGMGERAVKLRAGLVTPQFMQMLGVVPVAGRAFASDDAHAGSVPAAMLSDALWETRFGRRSDALGKSLSIEGRSFTIVGVLGRDFTGIDAAPVDVWLPLERTANELIMPGYLTQRGAAAISLVARIPSPDSRAAVENAVTGVFRSSMSWLRTFDTTDRALVAPLLRERGPGQGEQSRVSMWLGAVSLVVLAIACLNCAALVLVRGFRRRSEFAVRMALGAERARLLRMIAAESVFLGLLSAAAAAGIAALCSQTLRGLLVPADATGGFVSLPRVFLFTLTAALVAGFVGSFPLMLQVSREDFLSGLKTGPRAGFRLWSRTRALSLTAQVALTTALLAGAGVFIVSLRNATAVDLGFEPKDAWAVNIDFAGMAARSGSDLSADLYRRLEAAVQAKPGVVATGVTTSMPFQNISPTRISISGRDSTTLPKDPVHLFLASEGYLKAIGLRLKVGRWFDSRDYTSATATAVVNETMAKAYWPGESALGKCLLSSGDTQCRSVIGVVGDTRRSNLREDPRGQLYLATLQNPAVARYLPRTLVVRTAKGFSATSAIRDAIYSVDKTLAYVSTQPVEQLIAPKLFAWRLGAAMMTAFGAVALTLALLGLYGAMSWMVAERSHEFGVRLALGATQLHVARLVARQAFGVVSVGVVGGTLVLVLGAERLEPLLFGVRAFSPPVVGIATIAIAVAAFAACYPPARRAGRVDPLEVLKSA